MNRSEITRELESLLDDSTESPLVIVSFDELGFPEGATLKEACEKAQKEGSPDLSKKKCLSGANTGHED